MKDNSNLNWGSLGVFCLAMVGISKLGGVAVLVMPGKPITQGMGPCRFSR